MKSLNRLKFLRIIVCGGFIGGILFSRELWFPLDRTFPRAPLFGEAPLWLERLLTLVLVVALGFIAFSARRKIFFITALVAALVLISFDQTRLQPWVYQYFLLLVIMALSDWQTEDETKSNQTLALAQILIAALYFWSGVQKLNFTFSHETLPKLLAPLQNLFPATPLPFAWLGIAVALIESLIGAGLLYRKTRNLAACFAVLMHLSILGLLIAEDYNSVVWVWNAALIALVVGSFWKSDVSIKQTMQDASRLKIAKSIIAASALLPVLSFFGGWDMFLSGALYSGNVEIAVVLTDENFYGKLPPKAQQAVFQTKNGARMLPLFEWSIAELNVPVYPERRAFREIFARLCKLRESQSQPELIIKQRPAIFDGSYKIARVNCDEKE
ncbi:MAG TPA: hypothetical protein VGC97_23400 [Pyrinomonadaceae bacterium]